MIPGPGNFGFDSDGLFLYGSFEQFEAVNLSVGRAFL